MNLNQTKRKVTVAYLVSNLCIIALFFFFLFCSLQVLYAVNEFNGFFLKTSFMDAKQKYVSACTFFIIEQVRLTSLKQRQDQGFTQELMHFVTRGFFTPAITTKTVMTEIISLGRSCHSMRRKGRQRRNS